MRNPVVLVLLALPLATLAAGAATLWIIGRGGLDAVGEPVRRTAQVQVRDWAEDEAARRLGLSAELALEGAEVRLRLRGNAPETDLVLHLEHPLEAARDRDLPLQPRNDGWGGPAFDPGVHWRLALGPAGGGWRLVGRWAPGAGQATLAPALGDGGGERDVAR
ncbi:FixH family protein [Silanimonas lenta]|uniref:FixH family protein n=1 Tax=Silanimonas lenta TaxID=265429 RepID=UPI000413473F|nr:FixH family protein [Silanimonas lenta]